MARPELPFAPEPSAASAHLPVGPASPRWRRFDRLVVALVLVGLCAPWALLLGGRRPKPIENRPLVAFPQLTLTGLLDGSAMRGIDAFLADNIAVRSYAVRVRGEVIRLSGGTGNPQVIRGVDNWLFSRSELEPTCGYDAATVLTSIQAAASTIAAHGGTFRFLAVPDKRAIYPEKLPVDPFPAPCTELRRQAFRAGLASIAPIGVDGWSPLLAKRASDPSALLYWPGDTHWTALGSLQDIRDLVRSLDPSLWSDSDVVISGLRARTVDLELQLGIRRVETTPHVTTRPAMTVSRTDLSVPVEIHNARTIWTTTATGPQRTVPGRTLVVYDSFFGLDYGLVAPYFASATWLHVGDLENHPELAAVLGHFDTVIVERVERAIYTTDPATLLAQLER